MDKKEKLFKTPMSGKTMQEGLEKVKKKQNELIKDLEENLEKIKEKLKE